MPKAKVTFQDIGVSVTVPAGTRLIEVSEKVGAGITYGCREGECCTCLTKIISGGENLASPSVLEDQVLKDNMAPRGHRELGFSANAMLVHDIPDADVDRVAAGLAGEDAVTLCYRRPRHLPHWPYNLFCMIHGQCRDSVAGTIDRLRHRHALAAVPHAVLFSQRCFKQTGARYV